MVPLQTPLSRFQVIINDNLCISHEYKQFRFPKQKNHRRVKKYRKNKKNWKKVEFHEAIQIMDKLIVSSKVYKQIEKIISKP